MNDSGPAAVSERAAALWRAYLAGLPPDHPHWTVRITEFSFGDSPAMADELAALVVSGRKQATATLAIQFAVEGAALPAVGDVSIVTRADGAPVAAIETTDVRVVPFDAVDAEFAHAEGEGDRSLAWWRAAHTPTSAACSRRLAAASTAHRSSSANASGSSASSATARRPR